MTTEISFHQLAYNLDRFLTSHGTVLNSRLQLEESVLPFHKVKHAEILTTIFRRLHSETPIRADDRQDLAVLSVRIREYRAKLMASHKLQNRPPNQIVMGLIDGVQTCLSTLQPQPKTIDDASDIQATYTALSSPLPTERELTLLYGFVRENAIMCHMFRALLLTIQLVTKEQKTRQEMLKQGWSIIPSGADHEYTPPSSFFDAPVPVMLVGSRIGRMIAGISPDKDCEIHPGFQDVFNPVVRLIQRGKTAYPEYAAVFDAFLSCAHNQESDILAQQMKVETFDTLSRMRDTLVNMCPGIIDLFKQFREWTRLHTIIENCTNSLEHTPSMDHEQTVNTLEGARAKLETTIIGMSSCVDNNLVLLKQIAPLYEKGFHQLERHKAEFLVFKSKIPLRIFEAGSFFSQFVSEKIPSPQEFYELTAPTLVLRTTMDPSQFPHTEPLTSKEDDPPPALLDPKPSTHITSPAAQPGHHRSKKKGVRFHSRETALSQPHHEDIHVTEESPSQKESDNVVDKENTGLSVHHMQPQSQSAQGQEETPDQEPHEQINPSAVERTPLSVQPEKMPSKQKRSLKKQPGASVSSTPIPSSQKSSPKHNERNGKQLSLMFHTGDRARAYPFADHAGRWFDPNRKPCDEDPAYSSHHYPQLVLARIIQEHTPPLVCLNILFTKGVQYTDGGGKVESRSLFARVTWPEDPFQGWKEGMMSVGRVLKTGDIYHFFFSKLTPEQQKEWYVSRRMHQPLVEKLPQRQKEISRPDVRFFEDNSQIDSIADDGTGTIVVSVSNEAPPVKVQLYIEENSSL